MNYDYIITFFPFHFKKLIYMKYIARYDSIIILPPFQKTKYIKVDIFLYYFTKRLRWSWRLRNCPIILCEPNSSEDTFHQNFHSRNIAESFCPFFPFFFEIFIHIYIQTTNSHQICFHKNLSHRTREKKKRRTARSLMPTHLILLGRSPYILNIIHS